MTIEIRQMMIKSSIDNDAAKSAGKSAGKSSQKSPDKDGACEDCGNCEGGLGGSEERQRMRAMLAAEFERMRER